MPAGLQRREQAPFLAAELQPLQGNARCRVIRVRHQECSKPALRSRCPDPPVLQAALLHCPDSSFLGLWLLVCFVAKQIPAVAFLLAFPCSVAGLGMRRKLLRGPLPLGAGCSGAASPVAVSWRGMAATTNNLEGAALKNLSVD